jgi:hypothetical protein
LRSGNVVLLFVEPRWRVRYAWLQKWADFVMMSDRIDCEILKRAAEVAGGEDKLAPQLDVTTEDMQGWVQGRATARAGVYIIALDILLRGAEDLPARKAESESPAQ